MERFRRNPNPRTDVPNAQTCGTERVADLLGEHRAVLRRPSRVAMVFEIAGRGWVLFETRAAVETWHKLGAESLRSVPESCVAIP